MLFFSPCLGTPWLCLSGGEWAEPMPAQVPFYCVLPNCKYYPCNNGNKKFECRLRLKLKRPIKCMSDLNQKQEELFIEKCFLSGNLSKIVLPLLSEFHEEDSKFWFPKNEIFGVCMNPEILPLLY